KEVGRTCRDFIEHVTPTPLTAKAARDADQSPRRTDLGSAGDHLPHVRRNHLSPRSHVPPDDAL
ncbi:hypothetical protein BHM03_00039685, partial [Ensete ventricosum]